MSDQNILHDREPRAIDREPRPDPRGAALRAPAPTSGQRLTRRRRTADPFHIDPSIIPKGWSYEWKRASVHGQPDNEHMINLRENHWTPVPAERHPSLAAAGDSTIRRQGSMLMERPKYLTDEAQMEDMQAAMAPVQKMEEVMFGTPANQLPRDHPSVRKIAGVRQTWAPGEGPGGEDGTTGLSAEP